jgi:tetratricopeptide (TPR) repeat protein
MMAFNGDVVRELAAQYLALAEQQGATPVPLMMGHRIMGTSLLFAGDFAQARTHYDKGIALYDPAEHRPLATRFSYDVGVSILSHRSWALWILGYPEAALADTEDALTDAREIGQATTLMNALFHAGPTYIFCGNYAQANVLVDELVGWRTRKAPYPGRRAEC